MQDASTNVESGQCNHRHRRTIGWDQRLTPPTSIWNWTWKRLANDLFNESMSHCNSSSKEEDTNMGRRTRMPFDRAYLAQRSPSNACFIDSTLEIELSTTKNLPSTDCVSSIATIGFRIPHVLARESLTRKSGHLLRRNQAAGNRGGTNWSVRRIVEQFRIREISLIRPPKPMHPRAIGKTRTLGC